MLLRLPDFRFCSLYNLHLRIMRLYYCPKLQAILLKPCDQTKFEVLLLNPSQVAEFNFLYEQKSWVQDEPLFSSWLTLKLATIPTEKEALDNILRSHKALNVPKRKNKRKQSLPSGPSRLVIKCQFL